ncbi:MAG: hypothetical protein M1830_008577 [Pleopsidium flavum]|nr:MAG: hypothetical protein M1830_008577 [Pleopsidium flavum]
MSSVGEMPAMAHSPNYHIRQQRQSEALQHSFDTTLPAKPLPVASIIVAPQHSLNAARSIDSLRSSLSHFSPPKAAQSLSGSSTASYSQPANIGSERNQYAPFAGFSKPERTQGHTNHSQGKNNAYSEPPMRSRGQMPWHQYPHGQPADLTTFTYTRHEDMDEDMEPGDHALWILFWLSFLCPLFTMIICLHTMGALIIITMLSPLRLCTNSRTYSHQVVRFLSPSLNAQISSIRASEDFINYSASMLVFVHLLSPLISFGVAVAAWVAAGFWFYTAILGDPDGTNGKDDGRAAVLGVRGWWERWLKKALR